MTQNQASPFNSLKAPTKVFQKEKKKKNPRTNLISSFNSLRPPTTVSQKGKKIPELKPTEYLHHEGLNFPINSLEHCGDETHQNNNKTKNSTVLDPQLSVLQVNLPIIELVEQRMQPNSSLSLFTQSLHILHQLHIKLVAHYAPASFFDFLPSHFREECSRTPPGIIPQCSPPLLSLSFFFAFSCC